MEKPNKWLIKAKEINDYLISKGILSIKKADIKVQFNIPHDYASAIWSGLANYGWAVYYAHLELVKPVESSGHKG
jgi:hypothetical protein